MGGITGFDELLAYDGDAGLCLQNDLLQILAFVAEHLVDEVDAAFLVEFDILLIGWGFLHHRFLAEFVNFMDDEDAQNQKA